MNHNVLKFTPAVFCVADTYHIMVPVKIKCSMWVKVGSEEYFDESNGILKTNVTVHRMIVPAFELESEKKYTVCFRREIERKPYWSEMGDIEEITFDFRPVTDGEIRAYHISDAHTMIETPVKAARTFENSKGKLDFLILNGDIPDSSGKIEHFDNIYAIAEMLTGGNIPVVFSRGNHDMRGVVAENIAEYTPCHNGNSYYTFKIGNIWGILVDCGEDKPDESTEYGHTICCHAFRKRQTRFIEAVIEKGEFLTEGIEHRLVISHHPFTTKQRPPFDIEQDLYGYWAQIIGKGIKPEVMICGHIHTTEIIYPGDEKDVLGQPCPIVIGARPVVFEEPDDRCEFTGVGYVFKKGGTEVVFTDEKGNIVGEHIL